VLGAKNKENEHLLQFTQKPQSVGPSGVEAEVSECKQPHQKKFAEKVCSKFKSDNVFLSTIVY